MINWAQYFMGIARLSALRSKDPNTRTGACLVNNSKRIIGIGYNGMPGGHDDFPWEKNDDFKKTKYSYVVHAETNAILNSTSNPKNSILYATLFPCNECAKIIVQCGIRKIIYYSDKYHTNDSWVVSRAILRKNNVEWKKIDHFDLSL